MLYEMMDSPGWQSIKKVNNAVKEDWIQQTVDFDMTSKTDDEMLRILRHRQGQIKGVTLFLNYLEKKKNSNLQKLFR